MLRQARYFLLPYLVLLGAGLAALLGQPAQAAFFWINGHHGPGLDLFFRFFTNIGDGLFYALVTVALLWVRFRWALLSLACFVVTSLAAQVAKQFFAADHPRPLAFFATHPGYPSLHKVPGVVLASFNSFPSGHSTTAFSVFLLLTLVTRRPAWGLALLPLAALAAYSRVYLAQHFPEDVLAGSLLGVGLTLATLRWLGPLADRPRWANWRLRGRRLVRN